MAREPKAVLGCDMLRVLVGENRTRSSFVKAAQSGGTVTWYGPKAAEPGDQAVFLFNRSWLTGRGMILTEPEPADHGRRPVSKMVVGELQLFRKPISLDEVARQIPEWRWLSYPRSYTTPDKSVASRLLALLPPEGHQGAHGPAKKTAAVPSSSKRRRPAKAATAATPERGKKKKVRAHVPWIVCTACGLEVRDSEFEDHRVDRHGYTRGVYVKEPRATVARPASLPPSRHEARRRPPKTAASQRQVGLSHGGQASALPPGPGWVRCEVCSVWVKHLARHGRRAHRGVQLRGDKGRTGGLHLPARPRIERCERCHNLVVDLASHSKAGCPNSIPARTQASVALERAQAAQLRAYVERLAQREKAGRRGPVSTGQTVVGAWAGSASVKARQEPSSTSVAHCWKCGHRLFVSGACSNRQCLTLIADE